MNKKLLLGTLTSLPILPVVLLSTSAINNKKIENNMGINRENVRSFAAFILYGAVGTIYNDYIIKGENKTNSSEAFGTISELFQRPH